MHGAIRRGHGPEDYCQARAQTRSQQAKDHDGQSADRDRGE
jgi:hypothetical protein